MSEIHPFNPFVPQGATILIIGTFPPLAQYRNFKFYYPNNSWKDDAAAEERKALFVREHIAITDMIEKCIRTNGDPSDKNLSEIKFRNIHKLLKDRPAIQKVILTSRTDGDSGQIHKKHLGKATNNSALELLNEHLMKNGIIIRNLHKEDNGTH